MDESQKRELQLAAVRELKEKGVTGIKLELEGTMQRRDVRVRYDRCDDCGGNGRIDCDPCQGLGWHVDDEGFETDDECELCESRGWSHCADCNGAGQIARDGQVDWSNDTAAFREYIRRVGEELGMEPVLPSNGNNYALDIFPWLKFAKLYFDGSVDTEVTFTVRLDDEENIFYIPAMLEVFKGLADTIGKGLDVRGAGMHTALIFDEDCNYPNNSAFPYTSTQKENFNRAVTQLLPAFYFLATATDRSRALGYRPPQIGGSGKNTALGYNGGAMEFRIFDTCYEKPEAALDNIVVIKNAMQYMSEEYISPEIGKEIGKNAITFGNNDGQKLARLYVTSDQVSALYAGLKRLKPEYYSVEELCEQRRFNRTVESAKRLLEEQREQAEMEYAEYVERFEWQIKAREQELSAFTMRNVIQEMGIDELRASSSQEIDKVIKDRIKSDMTSFKRSKKQAAKYINDRLAQLQRVGVGEFNISLQ